MPTKPIPQRLRRLTESDYLKISFDDEGALVVTKEETEDVIKQMLVNNYHLTASEIVSNLEKCLKNEIDAKFDCIEKELSAYIEFKINNLSEKLVEMLLNRKFNEEVDKKVQLRIQELKIKGKF